jgi:hypothetical protein
MVSHGQLQPVRLRNGHAVDEYRSPEGRLTLEERQEM